MNEQTSQGISLKKEPTESWTDPATGEIYPGGNPNAVSQQIPQPQTYPRQSANITNNAEIYPSNTAAQPSQPVQNGLQPGMKYCKYCGQQIPMEAVLCVKCGRQVEQLQGAQNANPQVVINNGQPVVYQTGVPKDKWVAFVLAFFLGVLGIHRFYEGKIGTGILWMFTGGMFGIGWLVDWITILTKPNPYYV